MKKQLEEALTLTTLMQQKAEDNDWEEFGQLSEQRLTVLQSIESTQNTGGEPGNIEERERSASLIQEIRKLDTQIHKIASGQQNEAQTALGKMSRANKAIAAYRQI